MSNSIDVDYFTLCAKVIFRYKTQAKVLGGWDIHQKYYNVCTKFLGDFEC